MECLHQQAGRRLGAHDNHRSAPASGPDQAAADGLFRQGSHDDRGDRRDKHRPGDGAGHGQPAASTTNCHPPTAVSRNAMTMIRRRNRATGPCRMPDTDL